MTDTNIATLKSIKIAGVKGRTRTLDLTGADIITGDNRTGKTTILRSVVLGLLGLDPALGKKTQHAMSLADGDRMTVDIEIAGCAELSGISRIFTRNPETGACKQAVSTFPATSARGAAEAVIADRLGIEATVLDLTDFLSLSAAGRREYLFRLCGDRLSMTADDAVALVKKHIGEHEHAAELCATVDEIVTNLAPAMKRDAVDVLVSIAETLKDLSSHSTKAHKEAVAAANKVTEAKNEDEARAAKPIDVCRAEIDDANKRLQEIAAEIAGAQQKTKRLEWLQNKVKSGAEHIEQAETKLNDLDDKLAGVRAAHSEAVARLEKNALALQTLAALKTEAAVLLETITSIESAAGKCPLSSAIECKTDLTALLESKRAELKTKDAEIESVAAGVVAAYGYCDITVDSATKEIEALETKTTSYEDSIGEMKKRIESDREKLAKDQKEIDESEAIADVSALESQKVGLNALIENNKVLIKTHEERNRDLKLIEKSRADAELHTGKLETIKIIQAAAGTKGALGEILVRAKESLLAEADAFVRSVMPDLSLTFDDNADLGVNLTKPDSGAALFIPFQTLSHSEQMVVFAALRIAVMVLKRSRLRVLIVDDIEGIDETYRGRFVQSCMALRESGTISNLLLAGVVGPAESIDGLNTITT